jgi:hypothetical protein
MVQGFSIAFRLRLSEDGNQLELVGYDTNFFFDFTDKRIIQALAMLGVPAD